MEKEERSMKMAIIMVIIALAFLLPLLAYSGI